jgi:hypothetical protein
MTHPALFLKAHVNSFVRKDGAVVAAHETKVQAASGGPAEGEIGSHEHKQYGHYFRPGDKAKDREGNTHTVVEHRGPQVRTLGGGHFHPTKLTPHVDAPASAAAPAATPKKPAPKPAPALDPHPNVIGKASSVTPSGMSMKFGDKTYERTGKDGKSIHDGTRVEEYEHEDSGHRVWKDATHRVHADSAEEAKKARSGK